MARKLEADCDASSPLAEIMGDGHSCETTAGQEPALPEWAISIAPMQDLNTDRILRTSSPATNARNMVLHKNSIIHTVCTCCHSENTHDAFRFHMCSEQISEESSLFERDRCRVPFDDISNGKPLILPFQAGHEVLHPVVIEDRLRNGFRVRRKG